MSSRGDLLTKLIKNIKNTDDPITPLIDEYMLTRDKSDSRYFGFPTSVEDRYRPIGRLSPSSICGCPRQAAFKFLGIKGQTSIEPATEAKFDDGKWRHLRLDWQLKDMEAVLGKDKFRVISIEEFVKYPKLRIAGSLDICVAVYGIPYVIDFKGINSYGFEWVFSRQEPKKEHVRQLISYERMRKVKRGAIWYENKNDNRTLIYMVTWTPELWKEVREWCSDVLDDIERERLPNRAHECKRGQYLFNRCPFAGICFGGDTDARIERKTYRDFIDIDTLWEEGLRIAGQE